MSDHDDAIAKGVLLLKTIGLDITYTDEGLEVIVRQIMRLGHADEREAVAKFIDALLASDEGDEMSSDAVEWVEWIAKKIRAKGTSDEGRNTG